MQNGPFSLSAKPGYSLYYFKGSKILFTLFMLNCDMCKFMES